MTFFYVSFTKILFLLPYIYGPQYFLDYMILRRKTNKSCDVTALRNDPRN